MIDLKLNGDWNRSWDKVADKNKASAPGTGDRINPAIAIAEDRRCSAISRESLQNREDFDFVFLAEKRIESRCVEDGNHYDTQDKA
jgi:hypothetical protein